MDGTYQITVTVEVPLKDTGKYTCHVEHISLEKPLIVNWELKSNPVLWIVIGVIAVLGVIGIVVGFVIWKKLSGNNLANCNVTDQTEHLVRICLNKAGAGYPCMFTGGAITASVWLEQDIPACSQVEQSLPRCGWSRLFPACSQVEQSLPRCGWSRLFPACSQVEQSLPQCGWSRLFPACSQVEQSLPRCGWSRIFLHVHRWSNHCLGVAGAGYSLHVHRWSNHCLGVAGAGYPCMFTGGAITASVWLEQDIPACSQVEQSLPQCGWSRIFLHVHRWSNHCLSVAGAGYSLHVHRWSNHCLSVAGAGYPCMFTGGAITASVRAAGTQTNTGISLNLSNPCFLGCSLLSLCYRLYPLPVK
ncbi:class I histocompatibility antigen, F10 alpha chain-like isoform X1 [Pelobates cultripes]|uniref:Class I histocompatibility antigen, F10 alpha chain-like isoform X1 n=1 Tax=Pelobates cultripes TaxID=61616 RepID=A0AAD1T0G5_PELCU|nr:class I histocompatibility antigen, F10 alpha chain-like isoform X1 [Pelobates cultripes]